MRDCNKAEIEIGDKVVTSQRQGSSCWLAQGVVDAVRSDGRPVLRSEHDRQTKSGPVPRYYTYRGSSQAILVIKKATKAVEVETSYNFNWGV